MRVLFPFVGDSLGGSHKSTLLLIEFLETKNIETIVVLHQRYEPLVKLLEEKGCFAIVLEKIPAKLASKVAKSVSIPLFFIAGINIEPKAEASAVADPEIPEKNMLETIETWAKPPLI